MYVIFSAELPGIVVAPTVDVVFLIDDSNVTSSEAHLLDRILKRCFKLRLIYARFEKWSPVLDASDQSRQSLKLLNEAICRPCAHRPAPKHHLVTLIDQSQILAIARYYALNVLVL